MGLSFDYEDYAQDERSCVCDDGEFGSNRAEVIGV